MRYYERRGLLEAPVRSPAGHRLYDGNERERLHFILQAKATGLSLAEIREVLDLRRQGHAPCAAVQALTERRLDQVDRHIAAL